MSENEGEKIFWRIFKYVFIFMLFSVLVILIGQITYDPGLKLKIYDDGYADAIEAAVQLGRLDIVSALLGMIGVLLGVLAIAGFGYIRIRSSQIAEQVARKEPGRRKL